MRNVTLIQSVGNRDRIFSAHSTTQIRFPDRISSRPMSRASSSEERRYTSTWHSGRRPWCSVIIVKLGLTIRSGKIPRTSPTPLQKTVFPAPRSPVSATTSPGTNKRPSARATRRVSSSPEDRSVTSIPGHPESGRTLRSLGGGLRSWLAVRGTCTAALNLTAPPLLRLAAPATGDPRRCGGLPEAGDILGTFLAFIFSRLRSVPSQREGVSLPTSVTPPRQARPGSSGAPRGCCR